MNPRRQRLDLARLYLICDARSDAFLHSVLSAGVDLVQLRMKDAGDAELVDVGRRFREVCSQHGALLILNDRPDLVAAVEADGVHVGQDDVGVTVARRMVGQDRLVGLSTHSPEQIEAAVGVDYLGVGPVFATPTKPGRPAVGLELVSYAAVHAQGPWFAIGGISPDNLAEVRSAGAARIAVVRALTESPEPAETARRLRSTLTQESLVGSAQS